MNIQALYYYHCLIKTIQNLFLLYQTKIKMFYLIKNQGQCIFCFCLVQTFTVIFLKIYLLTSVSILVQLISSNQLIQNQISKQVLPIFFLHYFLLIILPSLLVQKYLWVSLKKISIFHFPFLVLILLPKFRKYKTYKYTKNFLQNWLLQITKAIFYKLIW